SQTGPPAERSRSASRSPDAPQLSSASTAARARARRVRPVRYRSPGRVPKMRARGDMSVSVSRREAGELRRARGGRRGAGRGRWTGRERRLLLDETGPGNAAGGQDVDNVDERWRAAGIDELALRPRRHGEAARPLLAADAVAVSQRRARGQSRVVEPEPAG